MSETDSFIEEVSEEVRRDRLFQLFRRYGWIAILAVALLVGGVWYTDHSRRTAEAEARRLGDAVLAAMSLPDTTSRAAALAEIETEGSAATGAVLALVSAAAEVDTGDIRAADATLAAVAANGDVPELYRHLAMLKRLYLSGSGLSGEDRRATIDALAVPGQPFRTLAEEQRALMHFEAGEAEAARAIYFALIADVESTPQLVNRARQMLIVLGGPPEDS